MNLLAYVHLRNIYGSTGAGRVARQLVEHLAKDKSTNLHILADSRDHQRIVPKVGEPWSGFAYHFFRHDTSWQQARWLFIGKPTAHDYWPEAQIIFCTAESYVPKAGAKLVVTLHDAACFEEGVQTPTLVNKQRLKWRYMYRVLSRNADLFHTVSAFSAERIAHFFPELRSRLRVVHNGIPDRFFAPESEQGNSELAALGLTQVPFVLLPRGLSYRKNADLALKAWPRIHSLHPELKLVITSHSDQPYVQRALALGNSVVLTNYVSDEALRSLYATARVVWFPSLYEGFGLPALEAMACGAPVVASNSSSLPEVCGPAAILVPTHSVDDHVQAISALVNDGEARESLAKAGREWAARFTWQSAASKLRAHFQSLL